MKKPNNVLELRHLHLMTLTHQEFSLEEIGRFHLDDEAQATRLPQALSNNTPSELLFLSTCNRVALAWVSENSFSAADRTEWLKSIYPELPETVITETVSRARFYQGIDAVNHLFRVSSSLESLVIGEREIITQVRKAYERSVELGLAGDHLRLLIKQTVQAAKAVFTETSIANNPVSVVNLACRRLADLQLSNDSRVVFVGAGQTIKATVRKLHKMGFHRFTFFNRTPENAEELARQYNGQAFPLETIDSYQSGFDILVSCTGASTSVISPETYSNLLAGETSRKAVIDLAIPNDIDGTIYEQYTVNGIRIEDLKEVAARNLEERKKELSACEAIIDRFLAEYREIFRMRQVELAMRAVPAKVKEIRHTAVNEVFSDQLENLDAESRQVLDNVIGYLEKKYISVPMKMAREIMLQKTGS